MENTQYKFKLPPTRHQLDWWLKSRDMEHFAVFWEMGTGKSKFILDTAAWLYDNGKIDSMLIFANKGSYQNWADEHIPLHLPDHVTRKVLVWDSRASQAGLMECAHFTQPCLELKIFIMNIEALAYERGRKVAERFASMTRCLGVIDESTSIKNPGALRTKAALKLRTRFKYRRILTGSPATNGPLNLYTQAEFLAPWLLGHGSWYSFRNEYCTMVEMRAGGHSFKRVVGYKNLEKLKVKMAPWSAVVRKEDCLDLPPKTYQTLQVELTPEQAKVYKDLRERSIAELSEGVVTAEMVMVKLLRLQQVLCGYVPNEEGKVIDLPEKRLETLLSVVEELQGKAIIWARFVQDIRKLSTALAKEYGEKAVVEYYGATTQEGRRDARREFQEGDARFFIGNPQTAGYGLTLTAAATVIYYSNSFDLEHRVQSEDRCHRIGQTKSVTYVDLVCPKTVDEKIVKALREKRKISDLIMGVEGWKNLI